jgi:hypothetical protein
MRIREKKLNKEMRDTITMSTQTKDSSMRMTVGRSGMISPIRR